MSDLLSIGASGVRAYQTALDTVSDNISNVGTAGYSRRVTTLAEVAPVDDTLAQSRTLVGNGVTVAGVGRTGDQYQAAAVRSSAADLSRTQTGATWLGTVQSALTGNGLGGAVTGFFADATTLAANPTSSAARSTLLEAGTTVASAFAGTGRALDQAASDLDSTADDATASLDSLGAALAKVNDGLGRVVAGGSAAASLADQRDSITEQMSAISDVDVRLDAQGRATVKLGGAGGPTFVDGNDAGVVTYARSSDTGAVSFAVHRDAQTSVLSPTGGALAGIADSANQIAGARSSLNKLATDFANGVNGVQAGGDDLNGNAGQPMFSTGATPTDLTMAITDPSGVAAASRGAGSSDNGNLSALAAVRTSGNYEARNTALVSDTAAALTAKQTVASAQTTIHDGATAARDAATGVNLDSEAVDLLRYQQAYSAASRVIQTARDTFQSILSIQ